MTQLIRPEIKDDLLSRGYSRRQMMRTAMMFARRRGRAEHQRRNRLRGGRRSGQGHGPHRPQRMLGGPDGAGPDGGQAALANSNRYSPNGEIETG